MVDGGTMHRGPWPLINTRDIPRVPDGPKAADCEAFGYWMALALACGAVPCPDCGHPLFIDEAAEKFTPGREEPEVVRIGACTGCEFVHEF